MIRTYTTAELADQCKSLIGKESVYSVSKLLGVSQQAVANWYKLGTVMDDETGIRVADALKIPRETVLMSLQLERVMKRGNANLTKTWRKIASQIS